MKFNERGTADARRVLSGKDAMVFDEDGEQLATVATWQAQIDISNADYTPLGTAQQYKHLLNYAVTLTLNETVIESSQHLQELYDMMSTGVPIYFTVQVEVKGWNGSSERVVFRDCVPDGQIDLHNMQNNELWVRNWTMHVNSPPELQKLLSYE